MNGYSRYDVLYDGHSNPTSEEEITLFLSNPMWKDLNDYILKECGAKPEISCNMYATKRRWNVEYNLNGRVLCTLFPEKNIFIAMVDVGPEDEEFVRSLLPGFACSVQQLFENTCKTPLGRWLAIEVTDRKILHNVKDLVMIRIRMPDCTT